MHQPSYPGVGIDRALLHEYFDSIEYALDALRARRWALDGSADTKTLADIYTCINDISTRLTPRLEGLTNALIRAHFAAGGSIAQLGHAMDKPRSTAQYRGEQVTKALPEHWEEWATGDLDGQRDLSDLREDPNRSNGYIAD